MKKEFYKTLILLFIITSTPLFSAREDKMPGISNGDLPSGGKILRDDYFDGKSLWGYIDGGADVYLEYGFRRLHLQEVSFKGVHAKIEIYEMNDPEAAFGIFSISRYKCANLPDSLSSFSCISNYQVQAARSSYYISVINDDGTPLEREISTQLVGMIIKQIPEDSISIPPLFLKDAFHPYLNELKSFHGKLGIQNGFPAWADQFDLYGKFSMYILPVEAENGYLYTGKVKFSSEDDLKDFCKKKGFLSIGKSLVSLSTNGVLKAVRQTNPNEIVFFESNLPNSEVEKFLKELE